MKKTCMFLMSMIAATLAAVGSPDIELEIGLIETDDGILGAMQLPSHPGVPVASIVASGENVRDILSSLENSEGATILLQPRVTLQSGSNATLKVVQEFIYPTDLALRDVSATNGQKVVKSIEIVPSNFQTRDVGVTLNLTSALGPKGDTIQLDLTGEIVSEPTWRLQYTLTCEGADGNTQAVPLKIPFFFTHQVAFSILLKNGAPVLLDGGIRRYTMRVEDRVPILGAIPGLGRLFRKSRDVEKEARLLLAITARRLTTTASALTESNKPDARDGLKPRP